MATDRRGVVVALKLAVRNKEREQDAYIKQIEKAVIRVDSAEIPFSIRSIGWKGLRTHMSRQSYPPTAEDWQGLLGIAPDDEPRRRELARIEDAELRDELRFYCHVADQTERMRAAATFYTLAEVTGRAVSSVFELWCRRAVYASLASTSEARAKQGLLLALIKAIDTIGEGAARNAQFAMSTEPESPF